MISEIKLKPISIIVAIANFNVIGKDNKLIWHIPEDLKRFKKITEGHNIIMGRKTFESLPKMKPLPNRNNIVLSKSLNASEIENLTIVKSISEAYDVCSNIDENFIIGGSSIYKYFLATVQKLYITKINQDFEGDTFFPEINYNEWNLIQFEKLNNFVDFLTYVRKSHLELKSTNFQS
jgi:dihydrofolate reductase